MFFEDVCKEIKNKISDQEDFRIDVEKDDSLEIYYDGGKQLISFIPKDEESIIVVFKNVATSMADGKKILEHRDNEELQTDLGEFTFIVNEQLGLLFTLDVNQDNKAHFTEDFISIAKEAFDGLEKASKAADAVEDKMDSQQDNAQHEKTEGNVRRGILDVVKSYLDRNQYNYKQVKSDVIVSGFNLGDYSSPSEGNSIRVYYESLNEGGLFRAEVPQLYEIYKDSDNSVEEKYVRYKLACMRCSMIEAEYHGIRFWIDPSDGQVWMRADIPLRQKGGAVAELSAEQVGWVTELFTEVANDTYKDFMRYVMDDKSEKNTWQQFMKEQKMLVTKELMKELSAEQLVEKSSAELDEWFEKLKASVVAEKGEG